MDKSLEVERGRYNDRDRLTVVHGNRLLRWAVMNYLPLPQKSSPEVFTLPFSREEVQDVVTSGTETLVRLVNELHPGAYPQPLFKNQTKCKQLGQRLLKVLRKL